MRVSTWSWLVATGALIGGLAAWVPVDWPALLAEVGTSLSEWGLFRPAGLVTLGGAGVLLSLVGMRVWQRGQRRATDSEAPEVRPLRLWLVVLAAGVIVTVVVAVGWWLLVLAVQAQDPAQARIGAVRTAMTLGAGLVGVVALWLTGRKQWLAERTQRHSESSTAEQQVTELYSAAANQLASDQAPVRLAGLYALSRLGQYNPSHRQTIVNLLCAYLRMPYTPPGMEDSRQDVSAGDPGDDTISAPAQQPLLLDLAPPLAEAAGLSPDGAEQRRQERQVRLTAQRLLTEHLRPELGEYGQSTNPYFWGGDEGTGLELDLAEATLEDWDFRGCQARRADFAEAQFHGRARFDEAQFHGRAGFGKAQFHRHARFSRVQFHGRAGFGEAQFHGRAGFGEAQFHSSAGFGKAQFHSSAGFEGAQFHGRARFDKAQFHSHARFNRVQFHSSAWFEGAQFHRHARFSRVQFHGGIGFAGTLFDQSPTFTSTWTRLDYDVLKVGHEVFASVWPLGYMVREADPGDGRVGQWGQFVLTDEAADGPRTNTSSSRSSPEERRVR